MSRIALDHKSSYHSPDHANGRNHHFVERSNGFKNANSIRQVQIKKNNTPLNAKMDKTRIIKK